MGQVVAAATFAFTQKNQVLVQMILLQRKFDELDLTSKEI
jgi:hypothetical protein